jgi:hypothetical protein
MSSANVTASPKKEYAIFTIDTPFFAAYREAANRGENMMRRRLIEALGYPRSLVQKIIDGRDCPHENLFEATSERCRQCGINRQCHWVACLNEFNDFEDKPTHTINASLRYGVKLVEALHSDLPHAETSCTCEPCTWMRDAQQLIEDYEGSLPPNPHRPTC